MRHSFARASLALAALALAATGLMAPAARAQSPAVVNVSNSVGVSGTPSAAFDAAGVLHVAWADNPGADDASVQRVFYARSLDGGSTFETPRRLSAGVDDGVRAREVRLVTDDAGDVAVAWWATVPGAGGGLVLANFLARSSDGGGSFAPAEPTSLRFRVGEFLEAGKEGFAYTQTLALRFAPNGALYFLATIQDYYHGYNVYFARTTGAGFSEPVRVTGYSQTIPRATTNALGVLPSGEILAFWTEGRGDFLDEIKYVYASVSRDGGQTFSSAEAVPGAAGAVAAVVPLGRKVLLLSQLQRTPTGRAAVVVGVSKNGGATFGARRKLGAAGSYSQMNQNSIAVDGTGRVAVAWTESTAHPGFENGIYVATSDDAARTFGAAQLVEEGASPDASAVVLSPDGRVGVVYTSSTARLSARDILFKFVSAPSQ